MVENAKNAALYVDDESSTKIDIEKLERELNESDWSRGWEQGRFDMLKAVRENVLPRNDNILRSAEIVVKLMQKRFGDAFGRIFAGFNGYYDEPSLLLCLKNGTNCARGDVVEYGVELIPFFMECELEPLRILVTKQNSTDFDTVVKDFQFERK